MCSKPPQIINNNKNDQIDPQFFHHIVIMGKFFLPTKCRLEPLYL